jgi:aspartyl-tRNA(Asn)/glutamyl-tRNA(Gln) amidotransferase subunit A
VTDRLCTVALGSDTGGSVRQPAALCGCVGFKPTYGAVSRHGLVAFASSLDQVGILARSVADTAAVYDVVSGPDPLDSTATTQPLPSASEALADSPRRLKLGVMAESHAAGVDPDVTEAVDRLAEVCRRVGHDVTEVSLPHLGRGTATYYIMANAEASANLARYDGVRFGPRAGKPRDLADLYARTRRAGFGREVKRRIMLGTYVLSHGYYEAYYLRALQVRNLIKADFAAAFAKADVLLSPTCPVPAFKLGEKVSDPLAMYLCDVFTVPANLAGIPAVSLPVGKNEAGLPLGVQLWGPRGSDHDLLAAAATIEELVGYDPH